jgi:hypothetical protein
VRIPAIANNDAKLRQACVNPILEAKSAKKNDHTQLKEACGGESEPDV